MGNAIWKGVRLRDLLEKAALEHDAQNIRFDGADRPVADVTPDFLKSLSLDGCLSRPCTCGLRHEWGTTALSQWLFLYDSWFPDGMPPIG